MESFFLILSYILIGLLLRKARILPENAPVVLNTYVLYVALPALILKNVPLLQFSSALFIPAVTPWILLLFVVLLVLLLARIFKWSREVTAAMLIILPLGNTSFLGYPMTEALYGEEGMPYAVIYDQLGSFIALTTYATIIAAVYGTQVEIPGVRKIVLKILSFPSFIALIIGLLSRDLVWPGFVVALIDGLAATLVPVVMIAVGFQLHFRFSKSELNPMMAALGIKLLLMPFVAWLLWKSLDKSGLVVDVSIFQAAMPPMISAGALAIMAGLAPRLVSGVIGFGILFSLITLPTLAWLLK
jgi:predicted permease